MHLHDIDFLPLQPIPYLLQNRIQWYTHPGHRTRSVAVHQESGHWRVKFVWITWRPFSSGTNFPTIRSWPSIYILRMMLLHHVEGGSQAETHHNKQFSCNQATIPFWIMHPGELTASETITSGRLWNTPFPFSVTFFNIHSIKDSWVFIDTNSEL